MVGSTYAEFAAVETGEGRDVAGCCLDEGPGVVFGGWFGGLSGWAFGGLGAFGWSARVAVAGDATEQIDD